MIQDTAAAFLEAWSRFDATRPLLIVTHNDADGLSAGALLKRACDIEGRPSDIRILGRGETPWSADIQAEWRGRDLGGLVVADLGTRAGTLGSTAPTLVIDHHVPTGRPDGAVLVSGFDEEPIPTSSLLVYRGISALTKSEDLVWLAAVGLIGDLGDKAPFAELEAAKVRFGATALKELVSLVNAPRRAAAGNAQPAFQLLLRGTSPKDAVKGPHPERDVLQAARDEVKAALEIGKRIGPKVRGDVALITLDTPCQIHPLIAQAWRTRLKDKIVIAANHGYRRDWVHFAARSATGRNLIAFLREVAPPTADENYGNGHEQATGGALRQADWPLFLRNIGFADSEAGR